MKNKIIIILIVLMLFSVSNLYLAGSIYYLKDLIWFILGFILIYIIGKINMPVLLNKSFYLYLFGNIILLYVLLNGNSVNGSRAWFSIGFISFQPSEFMKIFLILYLRYFSIRYNLSSFRYILYSFIIVLIPSILTFLEPDTGAVIIYFLIYIVFLFLKRFNKWVYIIPSIIILSFIGIFFSLYYLEEDIFIDIFGTSFFYRMDRITNFVRGEGYQLNEALKSISNSGLTGISDKVYYPEEYTDFIITTLIGNVGIIGLSIYLIIYSLLFYYLSKIKGDSYFRYSLYVILLFQYCVNILMNIGLFPIIGITLPFLSYGGSSLISYMILIGFVLKEKVSYDTYL